MGRGDRVRARAFSSQGVASLTSSRRGMIFFFFLFHREQQWQRHAFVCSALASVPRASLVLHEAGGSACCPLGVKGVGVLGGSPGCLRTAGARGGAHDDMHMARGWLLQSRTRARRWRKVTLNEAATGQRRCCCCPPLCLNV